MGYIQTRGLNEERSREIYRRLSSKMKIYIVMIDRPDPAENHITAVFNSREKAENFIKEHRFGNVDIPYIEEMDVE